MTDQAKSHHKAGNVLGLSNVISQNSYEEHYKHRNETVLWLYRSLPYCCRLSISKGWTMKASFQWVIVPRA